MIIQNKTKQLKIINWLNMKELVDVQVKNTNKITKHNHDNTKTLKQ